mgnify:CR=1 FL=1
MHIRPFQAAYPRLSDLSSVDVFFDQVKEAYGEYVQAGQYDRFRKDALYIYQIRTNNRYHTALLACADIRDYLTGHIRKHEHTLQYKEDKQLELLWKRQASVKPITLAYPDVEQVNHFLREYTRRMEPDLQVGLHGDQHLVWAIEEEVGIRKLQRLFAEKIPVAYIADGHHRTAAVARQFSLRGSAGSFDRLLCAFFPSSELEIHDFNRVIKDLGEWSTGHFLKRLKAVCHVTPLGQARKPQEKFHMLLYLNEEWFECCWKAEMLGRYQDQEVVLDAQLLNTWVLQDILGIEDVRNDPRISYVEGPRGLDALRQKVNKAVDNRLAFGLYPVQLEEMYAIADSQLELPPKSTWFEPRMKNGLIVLEYPEHLSGQ